MAAPTRCIAAVAAGVLGLGGCSTGHGSRGPSRPAAPERAMLDLPTGSLRLQGRALTLTLTGLEPGSSVVPRLLRGTCLDPLAPPLQTFSAARADAHGGVTATVRSSAAPARMHRARVVVESGGRPAVPLGCADVTDPARPQSVALFPQPGRKPAVTLALRYDGHHRSWSVHLRGVNLAPSQELTTVAEQGACNRFGTETASFGTVRATPQGRLEATLRAHVAQAPPRTGWYVLVRSGARPLVCLDLG